MEQEYHLGEAVNNSIKSFLERDIRNILEPFRPIFTESVLKTGHDYFRYLDGIVRWILVNGCRQLTNLLPQSVHFMLDP